MVKQVGFEVTIEGAWFAQTVRLDSTAGLYDWLRRRMKIAPSSAPRQFQIVGINYFGGKWIAQPPDVDWANREVFPHEVEMRFLILKDIFPTDNAALLDPHVVPADLNLIVDGIDSRAIESVPGVKPDRVPASEVGKKRWPHRKVEGLGGSDVPASTVQ
jgi:hypothetical protein